MKLFCATIPHKHQRYDTCGDFWIDPDGTYQIRISELSDWRFEVCIFVHESVEMFSCRAAGVDFKKIDDFDIAFELHRVSGNKSEPGDDPAAPYHFQHQIASGIERIVAGILGVNWDKYADAIEKLEWK